MSKRLRNFKKLLKQFNYLYYTKYQILGSQVAKHPVDTSFKGCKRILRTEDKKKRKSNKKRSDFYSRLNSASETKRQELLKESTYELLDFS